jgi:hypothetical protein
MTLIISLLAIINKNKMRKIFNWTMTFLALFGMTWFTGQSLIGGGTNSARAAAAKKSERNGHKVLLLKPQQEKSTLKKLSKLIEKEVICTVTEEQLVGLETQFGAATEEITVDGQTVTVVKISKDEVKRKQLLDYLLSTGSDDCKPAKSHNWFYVVFTANMS